MECPAEMVIDRPHPSNNFNWVWAVCQPDACWGEWYSGKSETYAKALAEAKSWLAVVHREQGY